MKTVLFVLALMTMTYGCQSNNSNATTTEPGVHKCIALEKINTTNYTYLLVNENGAEIWLAFPLAEIKIGETYYYANEMLMNNFESKELQRTFEKVYFISGVSLEPPSKQVAANPHHMNPQPIAESNPHTGNAVIKTQKEEVKIEQAKTGISIKELYAKKETYAGKKVTLKGKVIKFSAEIMGKNWIHLQDGTDFKGTFDLTVTTQETLKIGDVITVEGTIVLNKDFGSGYHYDVLMEDAVVKK